MPRDMDLVRELLIRLDALDLGGRWDLTAGEDPEVDVPGYSTGVINQHLELLRQAGLIIAPGSQPMAGVTFAGLTWEGHDLLDSVRDPEVWRRTKEGVGKMGGWTVDLLRDAAKAYLKHVAKERLGLDL